MKILSKGGLIIALIFAFGISACKKAKSETLKSVAGEWEIVEYLKDGESPFTEDYQFIKGTMNFEECDASANRKEECHVDITLDLLVFGDSLSIKRPITYEVVKKGEKIIFGDTIFDITTLNQSQFEFIEDDKSEIRYSYKLKR